MIIGIGLWRDQDFADLMFLGTAVAISAIPTGMPTFVQQMLAWGANQLAASKAIIASLNDVETLGATSAICSDKTGTLTMNEMMARVGLDRRPHLHGRRRRLLVRRHGSHVRRRTRRNGPARSRSRSRLPNDATVSADGVVIGDPTEAAFVVLAEKLGVDVAETKRRLPAPRRGAVRLGLQVHGDHSPRRRGRATRTPDRSSPRARQTCCSSAPSQAFMGRDETAPRSPSSPTPSPRRSSTARRRACARSRSLCASIDPKDEAAALADPMAAIKDLAFVGVVGIVDPLRLEAKLAVEEAQAAGITVRMITGDHVVTAAAIGKELGLKGEGLSGTDFAALTDEELDARLDTLSVFGRVTPQDKLRLVQRLQERGEVVAMTGDAVNDAAAIKQADIGVAMGSGSEVTKQAAKLVLTDDNFATLVHAVRLGRAVYQKIANYLTFQMGQLISLILLFLVASIFNINEGHGAHAHPGARAQLCGGDLRGVRDHPGARARRPHAAPATRRHQGHRQPQQHPPLARLRRARCSSRRSCRCGSSATSWFRARRRIPSR